MHVGRLGSLRSLNIHASLLMKTDPKESRISQSPAKVPLLVLCVLQLTNLHPSHLHIKLLNQTKLKINKQYNQVFGFLTICVLLIRVPLFYKTT